MPSIHETAYPRLKTSVRAQDLADVYTPTPAEVVLAGQLAKGSGARLCFLALLKTFQRLGYFIQLRDVPPQIITQIAKTLSCPVPAGELSGYDESGTRRRHVTVIRQHTGVAPFDETAQAVLAATVREAAQTKEDVVTMSWPPEGKAIYAKLDFVRCLTRERDSTRTRGKMGVTKQPSRHEVIGDVAVRSRSSCSAQV